MTVNGGATWSTSDNQPTGRFGPVATDTAFPYRICASERGGVPGCLTSRGDAGTIVASEWRPAGVAADGFVAIDPTDPDVIYSGSVARYDRRSSQIQNVSPSEVSRDRIGFRQPIVIAPTDSRTFYFGTNAVWKSTTAGQIWTMVSPDLSRGSSSGPGNLGSFREPARAEIQRGLISTLAPSPVDARTIWVGTDDGLVHVTRDTGVKWTDVTPPGLVAWERVAMIEASRFDANTAYAVIDKQRLDDAAPHLWRTRDGGVTWTDISNGLKATGVVYAVREDPFRRGLLFAATERSVSVSFDDGDTWQSLRLNLPAVPVRDLLVKDADLIASTDGRGFWVLDDFSPLRQITADVARADAFLFRPATAWRVRVVTGTAGFVSGEPSAANPPDGAVFNYLVRPGMTGPVTLDVIETVSGEVIRRFSSTPDATDRIPASRLDITPGLHRVVWDLRYTPVEGRGVFVLPGTYQVRLTVEGRPIRQAVIVRMDPRARTSTPDLTAQLKLSRALQDKRRDLSAARDRLRQSAAQPGTGIAALTDAMNDLTIALDAVQQSDLRPTPATEALANVAIDRATTVMAAVR